MIYDKSVKEWPGIRIVVSSANKIDFAGIKWEKSVTKIIYNSGPRMLPCGTPDVIGSEVEDIPLR